MNVANTNVYWRLILSLTKTIFVLYIIAHNQGYTDVCVCACVRVRARVMYTSVYYKLGLSCKIVT